MNTPYFLDVEDALTATGAAPEVPVEVRDFGLIAAAVSRPATTVFGQDAYPDLFTKAAALLHSLVRNHALVDGNKRAGWQRPGFFSKSMDLVDERSRCGFRRRVSSLSGHG